LVTYECKFKEDDAIIIGKIDTLHAAAVNRPAILYNGEIYANCEIGHLWNARFFFMFSAFFSMKMP
jgi:hypothetical protein